MSKIKRQQKKLKSRREKVEKKISEKRKLSRKNDSLEKEIVRLKWKNRERLEPIRNEKSS